MNQRHLLALLQNGYTTLEVVFPNAAQESRSKRYTYKVSLDMGVEVGDEVLVDTPSRGTTVVRVVEVHRHPKIDVNVHWTYKWVMQKVDRRAYEERLAKEEEFLEAMQHVERLHQREVLLAKFKEHMPPDAESRRLFDAAVAKVIGNE